MPPPRDLSGGIIMDFNQNAENRCICHPENQIDKNIFKFQTGVLCYNKLVISSLFHEIKLSIHLYSRIYTKMITLYYYKHCSIK